MLTVLLIEDDAVYRELATVVLEEAGCTVIPASTAEDGLRLARERPLDLVLTDQNLPGMDGFEVVRELRRDLRTSRLPVMVLTSGDVLEEDSARAREAGCSAYLTKPVDRSGFDSLLGRFR
jgi:CheY-like chemotaxis protein